MVRNHAASNSPAEAVQDREMPETASPATEETSPPVPAETPSTQPEPPAPPPPPDPPKTAASGSQWEIIYEVRREGKVKEVGVNVTATSEAEAFDLASKAVEALGSEDEPVTWRYTGRFRKIAA